MCLVALRTLLEMIPLDFLKCFKLSTKNQLKVPTSLSAGTRNMQKSQWVPCDVGGSKRSMSEDYSICFVCVCVSVWLCTVHLHCSQKRSTMEYKAVKPCTASQSKSPLSSSHLQHGLLYGKVAEVNTSMVWSTQGRDTAQTSQIVVWICLNRDSLVLIMAQVRCMWIS